MQTLFENMVVEWSLSDSKNSNIERILWISPSRDMLFSIAMQDDKALPVMKTFSEYMAGFESNLCRQIEWINDNIPLLESGIDREHLTLRDKSWDAIKDIVLNEPACFDKSYRGHVFENHRN